MDDRQRRRLVWGFRVGVLLLTGVWVFGAVEFGVRWVWGWSATSGDGWAWGAGLWVAMMPPVAYMMLARPLFAIADLWGSGVCRVSAWFSLGLGLWGAMSGVMWILYVVQGRMEPGDGGGRPGGWMAVQSSTDRVDTWIRFGVGVAPFLFSVVFGLACFSLARRARASVRLRVSGVLLLAWSVVAAVPVASRVLPMDRIDWQWLLWARWAEVGVSALMVVACVLLWCAARRLVTRPIDDGLCPECFYDLGGQREGGCPECGWGREGEGGERESES